MSISHVGQRRGHIRKMAMSSYTSLPRRRSLPRSTLMTPETSMLRQTTSSDDSETSTTESDHVDTTPDLRSSRWTKQDYTILETPGRAARRLTVAPAPALSTSPTECQPATLTPTSPATRRTPKLAARGTRTSTPSTPATSLRSTTSFHGHPPSVPHTFPPSRDPGIFRQGGRRARSAQRCLPEPKDHRGSVAEGLASGSSIRDRCNVLIDAGGVLNKWKWPAINGREMFKGPCSTAPTGTIWSR
jgi:hypothetical protein